MTEETNASESEVQITPVEASVLLSGAEWDPKLLATTLAQECEESKVHEGGRRA